jgi:acylphosphatase
MKPALALVALALLVLRPAPTFPADPAPTAVSGRVSGKVQQVGFRALILKEAIRFDLAGTAKNDADKTVAFVLQGDPGHIAKALKVIAKGTEKSSDVKVKTTPGRVDPKLKTFTVVGWTSTSRHITKPYDLVFTLRKDGKTVSEKEAHKEYHRILKKTLSKEDLKKAGLE